MGSGALLLERHRVKRVRRVSRRAYGLAWGIIWCVVLLQPPSTASAHHSESLSDFDASRPVTLVGTVVELRLVNPHSSIVFEAKDEQGTVRRWHIELALGVFVAPSRMGWRETEIRPGHYRHGCAGQGRQSRGQCAARGAHHADGFQYGDLRQGPTGLALHSAIVSTLNGP